MRVSPCQILVQSTRVQFEARQKFYAKRNEFYEKLHAEHDEKYAEKQALVKEAKSIAGLQEYTREQTAMMKELSNKINVNKVCNWIQGQQP